MKAIDLVGRKIGRLQILSFAGRNTQGAYSKRMWECLCECGKTVTLCSQVLLSAHTRSCGCLEKSNGAHLRKHGESGTPEYIHWLRIKSRCGNPKNKDYPNYGGRGITICKRWATDFEAFKNDMGGRPPGMTIGRIDNNAEYGPENCRWENISQQNNNKRDTNQVEFQGVTYTSISVCARAIGITRDSLRRRIQKEGIKCHKRIP